MEIPAFFYACFFSFFKTYLGNLRYVFLIIDQTDWIPYA
jgi:hypothetical protein